MITNWVTSFTIFPLGASFEFFEKSFFTLYSLNFIEQNWNLLFCCFCSHNNRNATGFWGLRIWRNWGVKYMTRYHQQNNLLVQKIRTASLFNFYPIIWYSRDFNFKWMIKIDRLETSVCQSAWGLLLVVGE